MIILHWNGPRGVIYGKWSNIYAAFLLLGIIITTSLALILGPDSAKRRAIPDPEKVILYPRAQNIQNESHTQGWDFEARRITTFETPASPDAVMTYYTNKMVGDGWDLTSVEPQPIATDSFAQFTFGKDCGIVFALPRIKKGCVTTYKVWVTARRLSNSVTSVEIARFY